MPQTKPRFVRLASVIVAALLLTVAAETAVLAVAVAKTGKAVTAVKVVTQSTLATTTSSTYANMPDMSTTITVPTNQQALLLITFSAETDCKLVEVEFGYCLMRVLVDGSPAAPGQVIFDGTWNNRGGTNPEGDQVSMQANSMQFVAGPLGSGSHTVTVQWLVNDPLENQFRVQERTLSVLRARV